MDKPVEAAREPIAVDLTVGREYWWCACGRSAAQPFCDGSHRGSGIDPLGFKAQKGGEAWLCRCKRTGNPPYCDGSHRQVREA